MGLLVKFTRYADYVQGLLVLAEIDESAAASILELEKARFLAGSWTGESTDRVAVQKAQATADPAVTKLEGEYEMARAKRKLRQVLFDSLTRDAAVVSRELTRRVGRDGPVRRADFGAP